MNLTDAYMTIAFLKRLVLPFDKWPAFKLGLIDEKGDLKKKRADMTDAERSVMGTFDLLVLNIKRIIEKVPGGLGRAATLAAALKLVTEEEASADLIGRILEDAPTNSAGSGQVAGMGIPADSLPGKKIPSIHLKRIRRKRR